MLYETTAKTIIMGNRSLPDPKSSSALSLDTSGLRTVENKPSLFMSPHLRHFDSHLTRIRENTSIFCHFPPSWCWMSEPSQPWIISGTLSLNFFLKPANDKRHLYEIVYLTSNCLLNWFSYCIQIRSSQLPDFLGRAITPVDELIPMRGLKDGESGELENAKASFWQIPRTRPLKCIANTAPWNRGGDGDHVRQRVKLLLPSPSSCKRKWEV